MAIQGLQSSHAPWTAAKPPTGAQTTNAAPQSAAPNQTNLCMTSGQGESSGRLASQGCSKSLQLTDLQESQAGSSTAMAGSEQHRLSPAGADTPGSAEAHMAATPSTPAVTPAATLQGAPEVLRSPMRDLWKDGLGSACNESADHAADEPSSHLPQPLLQQVT